MKLSHEEMAEGVKRQELIQQHIIIAQALEMHKSFWMTDILRKRGMDMTKRYEINFKNGEVSQTAEPEPQKDEPTGIKKDA